MYGLEGSYSGIAPEEPTQRVEYLLGITKQYRNLLEKIETADGQETIQRYTWDNTVEFMREQEGAYTYLQDESGSTLRLIRSCDDFQSVYGYDEFGVDLYVTQGETQPFGYTGYQKDMIANTYFAQAREYLPQIGRFAGNDFINGNRFEPLTFNKYWYCKNSPMNWVDLDGLKPKKDKDNIDWWEFLFGDSSFLNKNKNLKDGSYVKGGDYSSGENDLTRIRTNERNIFVEFFQAVDDKVDYAVERADAIFDANAEFGTGIGGDAYIGPVTGTFAIKLSCIEINEHGEVETKSIGKIGLKITDKKYALEGGYNYSAEKFYFKPIADTWSFDGDLKWSFGAEAYAGIGGGYSIDVNFSEAGETLWDWVTDTFGCDSQD